MGSPDPAAQSAGPPQSQTFRPMSMRDLRSDGHGIEHHSDRMNKLSERASSSDLLQPREERNLSAFMAVTAAKVTRY